MRCSPFIEHSLCRRFDLELQLVGRSSVRSKWKLKRKAHLINKVVNTGCKKPQGRYIGDYWIVLMPNNQMYLCRTNHFILVVVPVVTLSIDGSVKCTSNIRC